jgi:hypothetical protein
MARRFGDMGGERAFQRRGGFRLVAFGGLGHLGIAAVAHRVQHHRQRAERGGERDHLGLARRDLEGRGPGDGHRGDVAGRLEDLILGAQPLVEREHAQVGHHRLAGLHVAFRVDDATGDRIGEDDVHPVAGLDEAADAGGLADGNRDRALALRQHRGEEAAFAGMHRGGPGDRHAARQGLAGDAADQQRPAGVVGENHFGRDRRLVESDAGQMFGAQDRPGSQLDRRNKDFGGAWRLGFRRDGQLRRRPHLLKQVVPRADRDDQCDSADDDDAHDRAAPRGLSSTNLGGRLSRLQQGLQPARSGC